MSTAYVFGLTLPLMILEHLLCVMWKKLWLLWWSVSHCAHQTSVSFSFWSSFTAFFVTFRLSIACYIRHWPRIAPRQSQSRDSENGSQHTSPSHCPVNNLLHSSPETHFWAAFCFTRANTYIRALNTQTPRDLPTHRLDMKHVQKLGPHRSDPSLASHPSCTSITSTTRSRSRAELTADVNPRNAIRPHGNAPRPKVKRRPSPRPGSRSTPHKQKSARRGVGDLATVSVKRAGDTGCASDDARFFEAVSIGESLERGLDAFLPLLESVPPLFRSRGYHRRKNEFLNVKGILSATVRTLKATRRGDVRNIAQQYLLFKHMIYDNLRSLLLWLDSEMERYKETRPTSTLWFSPYLSWI
jgi:hypothetical protein